LAPTVGIAATGFCYPGGILQVFIDKISKICGCRRGSSSYIGEILQQQQQDHRQQQDRRRLVPAQFRVYRQFLLFMVISASSSRKNVVISSSRLNIRRKMESSPAARPYNAMKKS
jgi:hypothetical protein